MQFDTTKLLKEYGNLTYKQLKEKELALETIVETDDATLSHWVILKEVREILARIASVRKNYHEID